MSRRTEREANIEIAYLAIVTVANAANQELELFLITCWSHDVNSERRLDPALDGDSALAIVACRGGLSM